MRRIIPCLDVRNGRVVKGIRFAGLRDAGDPAERALAYELDGADELVLLDVTATHERRRATEDTIRAVRGHLGIPLTVGGGIARVQDGEALLRAGADKWSSISAAAARPQLIDELAHRFGSQCTVVAIDAEQHEGGWRLRTRSGTRVESGDVIDWAAEAESRGAGELLLTSFDRDGTRNGYDLELLRTVTTRVSIPVIASGGADSVDHMIDAFDAGAHAVLAASIFHGGDTTVTEVKQKLAAAGRRVRL